MVEQLEKHRFRYLLARADGNGYLDQWVAGSSPASPQIKNEPNDTALSCADKAAESITCSLFFNLLKRRAENESL